MPKYKGCEWLFIFSCVALLELVADFKNLDDPNDTSFDPHPTDYPVVELEYPNTSASERYV
jgi:hypothetical protein